MNIDFALFHIFTLSLLNFALYGWDKHKAIYGKRRISELALLAWAFLGGAFGALCAMILFRHKTRNTKFIVLIPLFLALQLGLVILLRTLA